MDRSRRLGLIVLAISAAAFASAMWPLARRIDDFNKHAGFRQLHAEVIQSREFKFAGFPPVSITDSADPGGRATVQLRYGDTSLPIPVQAPTVADAPTLAMYEEWLKVLAITQVERTATNDGSAPRAVPGSEQLLIVVRGTPEGFDPESWGQVRRTEWVFGFYRLLPSGEIDSYDRRWPRSVSGEKRLQEQAKEDPRLAALVKIEPLAERSVEYFAALHVIPKLSVPKYKFSDTAFSPRVLGWTLPVSMLAILSGVVGLVIWARPPPRRSSVSGSSETRRSGGQ